MLEVQCVPGLVEEARMLRPPVDEFEEATCVKNAKSRKNRMNRKSAHMNAIRQCFRIWTQTFIFWTLAIPATLYGSEY